MTMRSPLLLIAAAQAMVTRGRDLTWPSVAGAGRCGTGRASLIAGVGGKRPVATGALTSPPTDVENGMRLVHHVGYWSHYNIRVGASSWPFDPRCSLHTLFEQARLQSLFVDSAELGDLVVRLTPLGDPQRIGIILHVVQRVGLHRAPTALCDVIWALPNHGEMMSGIEHRLWLRATGSARFIAWHHLPAPQATRRRAS